MLEKLEIRRVDGIVMLWHGIGKGWIVLVAGGAVTIMTQ